VLKEQNVLWLKSHRGRGRGFDMPYTFRLTVMQVTTETLNAYIQLWGGDAALSYIVCQKFSVNGCIMIPYFEGIAFREHTYLVSTDILMGADHFRIFYDPIMEFTGSSPKPSTARFLIVKTHHGKAFLSLNMQSDGRVLRRVVTSCVV
jgi:hypothetical protein